jgi:hypothetical protein
MCERVQVIDGIRVAVWRFRSICHGSHRPAWRAMAPSGSRASKEARGYLSSQTATTIAGDVHA